MPNSVINPASTALTPIQVRAGQVASQQRAALHHMQIAWQAVESFLNSPNLSLPPEPSGKISATTKTQADALAAFSIHGIAPADVQAIHAIILDGITKITGAAPVPAWKKPGRITSVKPAGK